jgi:hypothetical protein
MPAVSIARLRAEVAWLGDLFGHPAEFSAGLHRLLDFYADRIYRAGQAIPPAPLIPTYHTPALVIQQLQLELRTRCLQDPPAGLALADILWSDTYMEVRKLGVYVLGQVPPKPLQPVLERIQAWARPQEPADMLRILLTEGTSRLRQEMPDTWLETIQTWVNTSVPETQFLGIQALIPLVEDRPFTNFPPVFRMISPFLYSPQAILLPGLQDILEILARRSPMETAFYLRQILGSPTPLATIRIVRRLMPIFDASTQDGLRKMLLAKPKTG